MPPSAELVLFDWTSVGIGTFLHLVVAVLVTLHSLSRPREPRSTLLWIYLAWALPALGPILYLAFGVNRVPSKGWQKQKSDQIFLDARRQAESDEEQPLYYWHGLQRALLTCPEDTADANLNRLLDRLVPQHPLLGGNRVETFVDGPEAYPAMAAAIRKARHHIHLQSYIIGHDRVGRAFLDLLAQRAREGIRVRLLYDDFGSAHARLRGLFRPYKKVPNMQIVGFTQVNPIKRQFQINLRNHRKLLIVDGQTGFTGGMNISAVHEPKRNDPPVRDYHFALRGPVVLELQYTFLRDWYYMTDENAALLLSESHFPRIETAGEIPMRIINAGPTSEREVLCDTYFSLIAAARRQILLGTPYFVPPDDLKRALRAAALRGVDVRLLLPVRTNHVPVTYAAQSAYEEMLSSGVRIFLRRPPFMHSKFMLLDDHIAMLGTANFDNRSLKLNYETNLLVFDADFTAQFKRLTWDDYRLSDELDLNLWKRRKFSTRLLENLFNLMSPTL